MNDLIHKFLAGIRGSSSGESSDTSSEDIFWKNLWKLNIPPKIRIFGWRVCKNLLPTGMNLKRRDMNIDGSCPFRHRAGETMLHCFRDCIFVRKFWS